MRIFSFFAEGMTAPKQWNNQFLFSLRDFSQEAYEKVPNFLKKKVELSPEYKGLNGQAIEQAMGSD